MKTVVKLYEIVAENQCQHILQGLHVFCFWFWQKLTLYVWQILVKLLQHSLNVQYIYNSAFVVNPICFIYLVPVFKCLLEMYLNYIKSFSLPMKP